MYKAVFFDIDGTLFNDRGEILKSTLQTIENLKKQNILVGIATGRGGTMINPVLKQVSFDTFVFLNGGLSIHKKDVRVEFSFLKNDLYRLQEIAKNHGHGLTFCAEDNCYLAHKSEMMQWALDKFKAPYTDYNENESDDVYAIWLNCPNEDIELYKDFEHLAIAPWTGKEGMFDILFKNVSKLEGIRKLVNELGISIEETIAIGDGFNDIEMIKGVGLGIAMDNAPDEVKLHAKMITSSNNEDGIANALKKIGLI